MISVNINKQCIKLNDSATLCDAIETAGITPTGIAIAVNDVVVPKSDYAGHHLSDGDNILIIKAFYGG